MALAFLSVSFFLIKQNRIKCCFNVWLDLHPIAGILVDPWKFVCEKNNPPWLSNTQELVREKELQFGRECKITNTFRDTTEMKMLFYEQNIICVFSRQKLLSVASGSSWTCCSSGLNLDTLSKAEQWCFSPGHLTCVCHRYLQQQSLFGRWILPQWHPECRM